MGKKGEGEGGEKEGEGSRQTDRFTDTIRKPSTFDGGKYGCMAVNDLGQDEVECTLEVRGTLRERERERETDRTDLIYIIDQ